MKNIVKILIVAMVFATAHSVQAGLVDKFKSWWKERKARSAAKRVIPVDTSEPARVLSAAERVAAAQKKLEEAQRNSEALAAKREAEAAALREKVAEQVRSGNTTRAKSLLARAKLAEQYAVRARAPLANLTKMHGAVGATVATVSVVQARQDGTDASRDAAHRVVVGQEQVSKSLEDQHRAKLHSMYAAGATQEQLREQAKLVVIAKQSGTQVATAGKALPKRTSLPRSGLPRHK